MDAGNRAQFNVCLFIADFITGRNQIYWKCVYVFDYNNKINMCVHMGDIHQYSPYCPFIIIITITIISEYILT